MNIEQIERILASEREDWQRRVNQGVLKSDLNQSVSALGAMDAIDKALYSLRMEWQREENARASGRRVQRKIEEVREIFGRKGRAK